MTLSTTRTRRGRGGKALCPPWPIALEAISQGTHSAERNGIVMKRQWSLGGRLWIAALVVLLCRPQMASAKDIGAEAPRCSTCVTCASCSPPQAQEPSDTGTTISRTEGNLTEVVDGVKVASSAGATLGFSAVYNSYNADLSRAQVDTVMGYGWTHSYNVLLFKQVGSMFRFDGEGRVTRYKLGAGSTYTAASGYFETLVKNPDGSFTLTQKDKTTYTFKLISGTPFLVVGPVYRMTKIVDRVGNTTTFTYTAGNLTSVTDTYGRSLTFTYTAQKKVASVTDPAGRVISFTYDSTGRKLTKVTDPNGKTIQYTYNILYQLTSKVDKDGRTFSYAYTSNRPVAVNDANGATTSRFSNPNNWATDSGQLAMNQLRVYLPSTTIKTDGRGNPWRYEYDSKGYLTKTIAPGGATTSYAYHPGTLMLSSATDPNGNTTSYLYDTQGNRTQMTDALGNVTTYTYEPVYNNMTSMTDPRGRTTTYAYDPNGNRLQETDPLGQTRSWTYDPNGNVLTATDKGGHTTSYTYDAFGNMAQITDPLSNVTTMTYDGVGNRTSRTDPNGRTTTYTYDGMNRPTIVTDPAGNTTQTQYDGQGNRVQSTDRNGRTTSYQYDLRQRLIKTTDPAGKIETYTYDGNDNRTSMTDRNTHVTSYQYDSRNRLVRVTDALGGVTTTAYDAASNITGTTDANAHTTVFTYDALNRQVSMTNAVGSVTQTTYDGGTFTPCTLCGATPGSSLITKQTDGNGKVTYFKYDALDRLVKTVRKVGPTVDTITAADAVTSTTYDADNNRLVGTEPNGNSTTSVYDAAERMTTRTNAAGDVTQMTYDPVGNVMTTTSPNGNVTTSTYDTLDRVILKTDSVGPVASYSYDPVGNRIAATDGNGNTTSYTYDALDRLIATTDPLGETTTYQYDPVGNMVSTVDRNANTTTYLYDFINRRVNSTDPLGGVTLTQYDPVGNRTKVTDPNGNATQYQYDFVNRMTRETYADASFRSVTYDPVGNVITRTDQIGQVTTFSYNDLHQLTARSYPSLVNDAYTYDLSGRMLTGLRGAWPVTFAYDGANRVVSTTQNGETVAYSYNIPGLTRMVTYPGGRFIVETTDLRSRLDKVDDAFSPPAIVQYTYDAGNRVLNRAYRNGTTATSTYNQNDWMLTYDHALGVTPIATFGYAYDNERNKTFEQKTFTPAAPNDSEAYQYDGLNRLVDYRVGTLVGSTVPVPTTQTSYSLDPVGNWNTKTTGPAGPVIETRVHDTVNQLVQIDATTISYDGNGNMVADGTFTYVYDEENRLVRVVRVSDSAIVGQYQYDALGRRVVKVASPAVGSTTTVYFYDHARVVEEQDGVGATQATYVYGTYVDEVLTMNRGAQTYYYHQNELWSSAAVTDSVGTVVERYAYDAYGSPTITDGAGAAVPPNAWGTPHSDIDNPYMFAGRQLDEETGLYFYRARYYDAFKGRFLQRDPVTYMDRLRRNPLQGTTGINLYEAFNGNPLRFTDWNGMDNPGCDLPDAIKPQANVVAHEDCMLRCCAQHDACFRRNGCTAWSWSYTFGICGPFLACSRCNLAVVGCFNVCLYGNPASITGPRWFCPNGPNAGRWYNNYAAIPASCWTNGVKP